MVLNRRENESHRALLSPSRDLEQPLSYQGLVLEASGREWRSELQQTVGYTHVDSDVSSSVPFEDFGHEINGENCGQNDNDSQSHVNVVKQSNTENNLPGTNARNAVRIHETKISTKLSDQSNEDKNQDEETKEDSSPSNSSSGSKTARKRPHYLSHEDRCEIIERIAGGEQQSALAREYGVTRAAVCHIQKHRFEILKRPVTQQTGDNADTTTKPASDEHVQEMRTPSVLLQLTTLRDRRSDAASFRRAAGRIIMILIEEVLGQIDTCTVEVITSSGHVATGIERKYEVCGVRLGDEGYPFSALFHQVELDAAEGYITVHSVVDQHGHRHWDLDRMDLPASIASCKVLLFTATCSNGTRECKAIEVLTSVGCVEKDITLVTIVCASDGVASVCSHFPQVRIVTASIDESVDPLNNDTVPGIGDFIARYNNEHAYTGR